MTTDQINPLIFIINADYQWVICSQNGTHIRSFNIVTFSGSLKKEGFKVDIDDGKTIEKLKEELLQPLPPEVEEELDNVLDEEGID